MFGTVLLAVDGSEHAEKAVDLATKLAQIDGDKVVLHVTEVMPTRFQVPSAVEYALDEETIQLARRYAEALEVAGVKARTEFRHIHSGHVARVICDTADELDTGLIVMGSRGSFRPDSRLLGSVAHEVLHLTDRPVLIAR
jgi:nucleotide-binding universal stress UspA family protein